MYNIFIIVYKSIFGFKNTILVISQKFGDTKRDKTPIPLIITFFIDSY